MLSSVSRPSSAPYEVLRVAQALRIPHRLGERKADFAPVLHAGIDVVDPVVEVRADQLVVGGRGDQRIAGLRGGPLHQQLPEVLARPALDRLHLQLVAQLVDAVDHGAAAALHHQLLVAVADFVAVAQVLIDRERLAVLGNRLDQVVGGVVVEAVRGEALPCDETVVLEAAAGADERVGGVVHRDGG
jgi:hypothetical protein